MAKSYAEKNAASVAATGKTLYERRIDSALAAGLSRDQGRGHPNTKKAEPLIKQLPKAQRPPRKKPVAPRPPRPQKPATKLSKAHSRGGTTKIPVYKQQQGKMVKQGERDAAIWRNAGSRRTINTLQSLEKTAPDAYVTIIATKNGKEYTIYGKGQRASRILTAITESGLSVQQWIASQVDTIYGEDDEDAGDDDDYTMEIIAAA